MTLEISDDQPTNAFGRQARHLCALHPPADQEVTQRLDEIRNAYGDLITRIEFLLPDRTPETTLAARAIHDACQRSIAAVVLNQGRDLERTPEADDA